MITTVKKKKSKGNALDKMIAEARREYAAGKTHVLTKKLLRSWMRVENDGRRGRLTSLDPSRDLRK